MKIGLSHKVKDFHKLKIQIIADGSPIDYNIKPATSAF